MAVAEAELKQLKKVHGKRYSKSVESLGDSYGQAVGIEKAFELIEASPKPKFDESVEVAFRLAVDPKQADQMIRGAVSLPHGTGKTVSVVVFAKGAKADEAKAAGADFVGAEELVDKINGGWQEFNSVVATPDMMSVVSRLGRVLGPRGLMPNPKLGTVTMDVAKVVDELKKGRVEYRVEKAGIIQVAIGKRSFGIQKLKENFDVIAGQVMKAKPASIKGLYVRSAYVTTTMGPSVWLDETELSALA